MGKEKTGSQIDIEWKNRVLCSDESCIGVIGPDGRCNECGKIYEGHENTFDNASRQTAAEFKPDAEPDAEPDTDTDSREATEEKEETIKTDIDSGWENRILCNDESCIGVIGPDGRCNECGKIYESK